ncbi:hypothetical protein BGX29_007487 [Mortierella sp. GBA35]|nr:hypothetical protein BGX29_007487 [Mortierella sp. GBA35]
MSSLLHCALPQLVARTAVSTVRQRSMATLSSAPTKAGATTTSNSASVKGAGPGKVAGAGIAKGATPPHPAANAKLNTNAAVEAEPSPLMEFWHAHKHQRVAIATVLVAAMCAESAFWYFSYFRDTKKEAEGETVQAQAVVNSLAQKQ